MTDEIVLAAVANNIEITKSPLAYGISVKNKDIPKSLDVLEPLIRNCDMCDDIAVRVGIYTDRVWSELRGLCERHKNQGIFNSEYVAWGWE